MDSVAKELGLVSAYHLTRGEVHGSATTPTFYWQKKRTQPYHIDYAYIPAAWQQRLTSVSVGSADEWLAQSDHAPIVVELAVNGKENLSTPITPTLP